MVSSNPWAQRGDRWVKYYQEQVSGWDPSSLRECDRFRCDIIPRSVFQAVQVETLLKCSRCSETLKVFAVAEGFHNYLIISTILVRFM